MRYQCFFEISQFHIANKKVENELNQIMQAGILEPVKIFNWTTSVIPILKQDGGIRICEDFSVTINKR